jgi:hypothetical protein
MIRNFRVPAATAGYVLRTENEDPFAGQVNAAGGNAMIMRSSGNHGDASNFNPQAVLELFEAHWGLPKILCEKLFYPGFDPPSAVRRPHSNGQRVTTLWSSPDDAPCPLLVDG